MTPSLHAPTWRLPLARLGLFSLAEAGTIAGAAVLLREVITPGGGAGLPVTAAALLAVAALSFGFGWLRAVSAEDIGMSYANEIRQVLAAHAAARGGDARLGTLAVRMTGDLNPMREWVAIGISEALAGGAAIVGALVALFVATGVSGLAVGLLLTTVSMVFVAIVRPQLVGAVRQLRRSRGRVAALAGDIVVGAAALHRYDAFSREGRRLARRGEKLRLDSVKRRRLAAVLEAPAALAAPVLVIGLALWRVRAGEIVAGGDVALVLFAAGLIGLGLRSCARAVDAHAAFSVAEGRMKELAQEIEGARGASSASERSAKEPRRAPFKIQGPEGVVEAKGGEVLLVHASRSADAIGWVERAAQAESGSVLGSSPLSVMSRRDRARRIALASPGVPLLRGSVRRNLSIRRVKAGDDEMRVALRLVGLSQAHWPLTRQIDPAIRRPDDLTQALLRLARAVTHRPRVILVAEPVLYHSPDALALYKRIGEATGAAIVAASAATGGCGDRQIRLDDAPE